MNKDQKPSIAVLMAAYNGMDWIEEQIDSIFAQADVEIDLYISVDLSNDGTEKWCQSLSQRDSRVHLLPYGDRFGSAAKNFYRLIREVDFTNYKFVAFADQDDVWLPNKLAHAIGIIRQKKIQAVSSDVIAFFQDGSEKLIKKSQPEQRFDYFFGSAGPGCTYVFRTDALIQFKNFLKEQWSAANEVDYHDWLVYAFFRKNLLSWKIDNKPLMLYRRHEFNQIGPNLGLRAYIKRLSMVRSRWYSKEVSKIFHLVDPLEESGLKLRRWFLVSHFRQLRRDTKEAFVLLLLLVSGFF